MIVLYVALNDNSLVNEHFEIEIERTFGTLKEFEEETHKKNTKSKFVTTLFLKTITTIKINEIQYNNIKINQYVNHNHNQKQTINNK